MLPVLLLLFVVPVVIQNQQKHVVVHGGLYLQYRPRESSSRYYNDGQNVDLMVNKITSTKTQIPLDYYSLPFCKPTTGIERESQNLGEFLAADMISNSPYKIKMKKDMYCEQLCISNVDGRSKEDSRTDQDSPEVFKSHGSENGTAQASTMDYPALNSYRSLMEEAKRISTIGMAIRHGYHNNLIVDGLPAGSIIEDSRRITRRYWQGIPIGYIGIENNTYIYNHVNIEIQYHEEESKAGSYRVVRFMVQPFSIQHVIQSKDLNDVEDSVKSKKMMEGRTIEDSIPTATAIITNPIRSCRRNAREHTEYDMVFAPGLNPQLASGNVLFTYDVIWKKASPGLDWASRWDIYLSMDSAIPESVHWNSIAMNVFVVLVLAMGIVNILKRTADKENHEEESKENKKWNSWVEQKWKRWVERLKLIGADVFRPPSSSPILLSVMCGTGGQLLCVTVLIILLSLFGIVSPARRGYLIMAGLILFVLMGTINGYITARLHKTFNGKSWWCTMTMAAITFPAIAFGVFCLTNHVALIHHSTHATPFNSILMLAVVVFMISTPLTYLGAYLGWKQDAIKFPVITSSAPRQIPNKLWCNIFLCFTVHVGGILPFACCFVELYYIMSALWLEYYYYSFGFLLLVLFLLLLTCAEVTIISVFFQLCWEDYRWWWKSFIGGGYVAIYYVLLYSFKYYEEELKADKSLATYVLYFGYMGLASLSLFCMMGFIGLTASLWFNKIIYSSIKIDVD